MTEGDWRTTFRPNTLGSARIYDYSLGGKSHFPAGREAAEERAFAGRGHHPGIRRRLPRGQEGLTSAKQAGSL